MLRSLGISAKLLPDAVVLGGKMMFWIRLGSVVVPVATPEVPPLATDPAVVIPLEVLAG